MDRMVAEYAERLQECVGGGHLCQPSPSMA